ncbi:ROK family protein [Streptomyces luteolus]|uniref:ROK family protein n=1 Tax=Streptomyces luteolus TaxID=3043615 RepID=A0ABT6T0W5_9ACTN|nr:ROK family protein [Streptomyces sp. B-S-A12]MDI3421484.1 ROK family protein [Streptomyces sp. B-S-A12]
MRPSRERAPGSVVGLDLGGTKIAAALVAADGTVLARHTRPTPATEGARAVLDALAAAATEVASGAEATAVGVAAAGVIDPVSGTVTGATDTISGWRGTPLAPALAARLDTPVACDNDVRATAGPELAALPEGSSLLYLAVGTGIGGAVAVDGRMAHGRLGVAGHLGHLPSPEADGVPCSCGAVGHLEGVAAGPGVTALYERLSGCRAERLQTVAARADRGDAAAAEAIAVGARAAGRALGGLANALGPDRVVVGGGVTGLGPRYLDPLAASFAAELLAPLRRLRPEPPRFGADAAVRGAALLPSTAPLHHPA